MVVRLDQDIYELLVQAADYAERIPEQHASFLVKRALLEQSEDESQQVSAAA